jgi:hypothetical protein
MSLESPAAGGLLALNAQSLGGDIWRMIAQESAPSLAWRPRSLEHVLRDARLRDFKPELEQLAVDARRPQIGFSILICRISVRRSASICGRPPKWARLPAPVAAFSASSRLFDLNGVAKTASTKNSSAIRVR